MNAYHAIEQVFGLGFSLFYRHTHLGGEIPSKGPVIVVANHPNALIDPIIVAKLSPTPLRFLAKEPLFRMPVIKWLVKAIDCLPVYRSKDGHDTAKNKNVFRAVYDSLDEGAHICLFPEGVGHNEPKLQPLKTGAARMALEAEARAGWNVGIKIVPVGVTFSDKPIFQSEVYTKTGPAINVADYQERYEADEMGTVHDLTAAIAEGLLDVTLNLDHWDDLPLIKLIDGIERPQDPLGPKDQANRIKLLADKLTLSKEAAPDELELLRTHLVDLRTALNDHGLELGHVTKRYTPWVLTRFIIRHAAVMLFGMPAVVLGALAYSPPYALLKWFPEWNKDPVDKLATTRIFGGLLILPTYHLTLTIMLGFIVGVWAVPLSIVLPFAGFYAHAFLIRRRRMFKDAYAYLKLMLNPKRRRPLLRLRSKAALQIKTLTNKLNESDN